MNKLHHLPALRLLMPFLAGIVAGLKEDQLPSFALELLGCLFVAFIIVQFIRLPAYAKTMNAVQGFFQLSLLFLSGYYYTWIRIPEHHIDHYSHYADSSTMATLRVTDLPELKGKNYRFMAEVESVQKGHQSIETSGKILVYMANDSNLLTPPQTGQILLTRSPMQVPSAAANPGGFDYRKYLEGLGIYHTMYLRQEYFQTIRTEQVPVIQSWVNQSTIFIQDLLTDKITDPENRAVGLALIMGDRSLLNTEILDKYSDTGTMHILAVSGLHVGILYLILEQLLNWLPYLKRKNISGRYLKPLIILIFIWFYATMTGLSPSVFRSAVMFSFLALGRPAGRYINSYNILAASAITLLIIDPLMATQVGFQLSFLAVLGIIAFQPYLAKLWRPYNAFNKYFWSILTVSVAAQIGTAPITIYYFHSFPNYFLLSNCLAIPISFIILCAGVAVIPFHVIPILGDVTSWILNLSLTAMDKSLMATGNIPGALTEHIHWTLGVSLCWYLLLFMVYLFLSEKNLFYLILSPVIASIILIQQSIHIMQEKSQDTLTLYSIKEGIAWGQRWGNQSTLHIQGDITGQVEQNIWPSAARRWTGIPDITIIPGDSTKNMCLTNGEHHILLLRNEIIHDLTCSPDMIVIEGNPKIRMQTIHAMFPDSYLIIGNQNSKKQVDYWCSYLNANNISHHTLRNNLAYSLSLSE